jgi:DNA-directed RNA polymerase specialized sigma subunit
MLRFYARYCDKDLESFKKSTDMKNWFAVKTVLDKLPEKDKNIIMEVYRRGDTLPDNIYWVAKELKVEQDMIWTLVSKVTKRIAKERGLI